MKAKEILTTAIWALLCTHGVMANPDAYLRYNMFVENGAGGFQSDTTADVAPLKGALGDDDAAGWADVEYGVAGVGAYAQYRVGASGIDQVAGMCMSTVWWEDTVTIDANGHTGTPGTAPCALTITGRAATYIAPEYADAMSAMAMFTTSVDVVTTAGIKRIGSAGATWHDGESSGSDPVLTTMDLEIPFTFGEPFQLLVRTFTSAYTGSLYPPPEGAGVKAWASIDLSGCAAWGGISEVIDEQGAAVCEPVILSVTGADYGQPIPEPATLTFFALAALAIIRPKRS